VNLRAAAQGLGLDMGSVGWAILERLVGLTTVGGEDEEGWREVWNAVVTGKVRFFVLRLSSCGPWFAGVGGSGM
jgi:hypothetical protein